MLTGVLADTRPSGYRSCRHVALTCLWPGPSSSVQAPAPQEDKAPELPPKPVPDLLSLDMEPEVSNAGSVIVHRCGCTAMGRVSQQGVVV